MGAAPGGLRVGVDLVEVADVASSLERFGPRYLSRLFTQAELASCRAGDGYAVDSLAARFAAKEAAVKVLEPSGARPAWRSIEIRRAKGGACTLALHGQAAQLARAAGLEAFAVSLTHEGPFAAAVVVAQGPGAPAGPAEAPLTPRRDPRGTPGAHSGL